ncbi:hypothetical protein ADUPG1_013183 [Aduncisulcus paluster]|uniref:Uncharacterized protein n=1 Tax=Aduncisulcus paluster TaxID=2918883 RepID=A0ABQ5K229_9EUKA|nr:hypothetical protein ADUPG1_013183 [Aduncisulcus paluster]
MRILAFRFKYNMVGEYLIIIGIDFKYRKDLSKIRGATLHDTFALGQDSCIAVLSGETDILKNIHDKYHYTIQNPPFISAKAQPYTKDVCVCKGPMSAADKDKLFEINPELPPIRTHNVPDKIGKDSIVPPYNKSFWGDKGKTFRSFTPSKSKAEYNVFQFLGVLQSKPPKIEESGKIYQYFCESLIDMEIATHALNWLPGVQISPMCPGFGRIKACDKVKVKYESCVPPYVIYAECLKFGDISLFSGMHYPKNGNPGVYWVVFKDHRSRDKCLTQKSITINIRDTPDGKISNSSVLTIESGSEGFKVPTSPKKRNTKPGPKKEKSSDEEDYSYSYSYTPDEASTADSSPKTQVWVKIKPVAAKGLGLGFFKKSISVKAAKKFLSAVIEKYSSKLKAMEEEIMSSILIPESVDGEKLVFCIMFNEYRTAVKFAKYAHKFDTIENIRYEDEDSGKMCVLPKEEAVKKIQDELPKHFANFKTRCDARSKMQIEVDMIQSALHDLDGLFREYKGRK